MKKLLALICFIGFASFAPGCAQVGLAPAQSLDQQLAYGYTAVASVRNTAADLLTSKVISVADAKMVQNMADQARAALDLGRTAIANGVPKDAQSALILANNVLTQIQTYLANRKGGS